MIPKETADLYMSIHAPDSLRRRIQEKAAAPLAKSRHSWKFALTAACLVLVIISTVAFLQRPSTELLLYDTIVEQSPLAVTSPIAIAARTINSNTFQLAIPLEIRGDAEISVSCGEVQWAEDNGSSSKSFTWLLSVDDVANAEATLTVTIKEKEMNYSLFSDETGTRYLVKAE